MEFRRKITPREIEMSFSEALMTGEIAAIALPPQIAVPEDIKCDILLFNFNNLPIKNPTIITMKMDVIVNVNPSFPIDNVSLIFIPNPNPTTATFKSQLTTL